MTLHVDGVGVQRDSRLPLYEQLKQHLLSQIRLGTLRVGQRLESEAELGARFGLSRTVVRQALGELAQHGHLTRIQGKGTFVSEPKLREHFLHTAGGFFHDFASRGHAVVSEVVDCREQEPSPEVAQNLGVSGDPVVTLERVRFVDAEPLAVTRSFLPTWLDPHLVDVLRDADLRHRSLYAVLEERCRVAIVSAVRRIEAVVADTALASSLRTPAGSPLLLLRSTAQDAQGRPVEYYEAWHRGDRALFEITVNAGAEDAPDPPIARLRQEAPAR